jgi:hypothetical protein
LDMVEVLTLYDTTSRFDRTAVQTRLFPQPLRHLPRQFGLTGPRRPHSHGNLGHVQLKPRLSSVGPITSTTDLCQHNNDDHVAMSIGPDQCYADVVIP